LWSGMVGRGFATTQRRRLYLNPALGLTRVPELLAFELLLPPSRFGSRVVGAPILFALNDLPTDPNCDIGPKPAGPGPKTLPAAWRLEPGCSARQSERQLQAGGLDYGGD
jgi:hypothetical protein